MSAERISFEAVKAVVSVEQVLNYFGINWLKKSGENLTGDCPFHCGSGFSISPIKKNFNCFGNTGGVRCAAHGNIIQFVTAMCVKNGEEWDDLKSALWLNKQFNLGVPIEQKKAAFKERKEAQGKKQPKAKASEDRGEVKYQTWVYQNLSLDHPCFEQLGLKRETLEYFGAGILPEERKSKLAGHIVCPVHDKEGFGVYQLLGYVGYLPDNPEEPKLPPGLDSSKVLYNLNQAVAAIGDEVIQRTAIVVHGCLAVMKIWQAGFPFVVGTFEWPLSLVQVAMLGTNFERVIVVLGVCATADKGTEIGASLMQLARVADTRLVGDGEKMIKQLSDDEIRQLFSGVLR